MVARAPLPAYAIENAMVNFQPLDRALEGYSRGIKEAGVSTAQINAANAMQAGDFERAASETARSGDVAGAVSLRRHPGEMRAQEDAARKRETEMMAGRAQTLMGIADPNQRRAEAERWFASDPRFAAARAARGGDPNDVDGFLGAIVSEARGVQDPLANDRTRAQTDLARAQADQARAHGELFRAQSATAGDGKAPSGFEWVDSRNHSLGLRAIPGGPGEHISSEVAGRLSLMNTAQEGIRATRSIYERAWGAGDFARQAGANLPYVGDLAIASGDLGIAQRNVRMGVEAALRVMTGAAAPEQEVTRYAAMFTPGARDTIESAKQKLDSLDTFMRNANEIATRGRSSTPPQAPPRQGATPAQSPVRDGATATNPQTGQRIIFRGGQWQPM